MVALIYRQLRHVEVTKSVNTVTEKSQKIRNVLDVRVSAMWKALGLEDRWSAGILAAAICLVALTPLGNEATQSFVFFSYRTLLFIIVVCCSVQVCRSGEPLPCPVFLGLATTVAVLMRVSSIANQGSSFNGFYYWYAQVLFGAAFIALAAYN